MIDLALNEAGEVTVIGGEFLWVDGAERVRQQLDFRLNLWRGEWFLDSEFGTPYVQQILGKPESVNAALNAIKTQILDVDGVNAISSFTYQFDKPSRALNIQFTAVTEYGLVQYP